MEFFLQMAWDIDKWNLDTQADFLTDWAGREFGQAHAGQIARIMLEYFSLNHERRPEHLQWWLPNHPVQASPLSGEEIRNRLTRFQWIVDECDQIQNNLQPEYRDAFFELVAYPVKASAAANRRYFCAEQYRRWYLRDQRTSRLFGQLARQGDAEIKDLTRHYNQEVADGKWHRIMAEEPADNMWRNYRLNPVTLPAPGLVADEPLRLEDLGSLTYIEEKPGNSPTVRIEREAESFEASGTVGGREWRILHGLGSAGAVLIPYPFSDDPIEAGPAITEAPWIEYTFSVSQIGNYTFSASLVPTYPLGSNGKLAIALGMDDGNITVAEVEQETNSDSWKQEVLSGRTTATNQLNIDQAGQHRLRIYLMDPGVVLDRWALELIQQGEKP